MMMTFVPFVVIFARLCEFLLHVFQNLDALGGIF